MSIPPLQTIATDEHRQVEMVGDHDPDGGEPRLGHDHPIYLFGSVHWRRYFHCAFFTTGCFHVPSRISCFGQ